MLSPPCSRRSTGLNGIPDRGDLAATRRATRQLQSGIAAATEEFEAHRLELMRGYMSVTLRAVSLPLVDLQDAGGFEIDAELSSMRPPPGWPWFDERDGSGAPRQWPAAQRFLHVVRQPSDGHRLLAIHVNGPSLDMVAEVDAGIVWTRHGRARLRSDEPLRRIDIGREVDGWCSGPPFAGRGYRLSRLIFDKKAGLTVGVFDVGWLEYKAPWTR